MLRASALFLALATPASAAPWMPDYSGMNMVFAADDASEITDRKAPPALPPLDLAAPVPPLVCEGIPSGHPGVCWVSGPWSWIAAGRPGRGHPPTWCFCGGRDYPRAPEPNPPFLVAPPPPGGAVAPVPLPAAGLMLLAGLLPLAWRKTR